MFKIKNISLTLKELGEIGRVGGVAQFRQTETIIATTRLPEFDDYVVNVFAPKNHIFGNFDRYWNLIASEHKYFQPLIKPERIEQTDLMLTKIIHLAGHKKKSNFSRNMMGLWTKRSAFDENSAPSDTSFCDHRHFSILVPQDDLNATFAHFAKQVEVFGDKSFVFMDDEARPGEFDDLRGTLHWKLLYQNIVQMNANERAWLCEEIQKYKTHHEIVSLASDLDYRFSARGLFSLSGVKLEFQKFVDMNCYLDMLLFRAKAALAVCRLPMLVFKENVIRNDGIEGCTNEIEGELLNMFAKKVEPYRTIVDFRYTSAN